MRKIFTIVLMALSFICVGQKDYPKLSTDSTGKKIVIFSYEQAQKIDNNLEIIKLLEKAGTECDSLNLKYIKVINELENQNKLLNSGSDLLKSQIVDKNSQIENLKQQITNCETNNTDCDSQIKLKEDQILTLKDELKTVKRKRNITYGAGILGVLATTFMYFALK